MRSPLRTATLDRVDEGAPVTTARNAQSHMTEAQIDRAIAAATAGHRMAGMEPSEYGIEVGRRQLRGEITGDEAVALVLAENRRRRAARS